MRPNNADVCPLCGRNVEEPIAGSRGEGDYSVRCPLCGWYRISMELFDSFPKIEKGDLQPYITMATRQASEEGRLLSLTSQNWRELAEARRQTSIQTKLDKLIRLSESRSSHYGKSVRIGYEDFPLFDAVDSEERAFILKHAVDSGYLYTAGNPEYFNLTAKGWEYLDPSGTGGGTRGHVFVAMSFDSSLDEVWDLGIKPAIERDCQLTKAIRIDKEHHNEKICDKILAEIRRCQFVVADYTQQKAGVYFEDGYAMGLGRQVIRSCREDDLKKGLHFDTRQYPYIPWKTYKDLREQLAERIQALILPGRRV